MESVIQQGRGKWIEASDLAPGLRAYNASVILFRGRELMSYRQEPTTGKLSRLRMVLMSDGRPISDLPLTVPESETGDSLEDPRLFEHDGRLWLAWTSALYRGKRWTCRQLYGELIESADGWSVGHAFAVRFGRNGGNSKEKNWQFFSVGDRLFAQYEPHHVIEIRGESVVGEWKVKPIDWRWGKTSGGTPPVRYADGQLITFFHAFEFDPVFQRRYNFAALIFEDRPPFRHVAVSAVPLVTGSETDPLPEGKIWQPLCIFPCGSFRSGNEWVVSAGVNDERIALLRLTDSDLILGSTSLDALPTVARVRITKPIVVRGKVHLPPGHIDLPRATALNLIHRRRVALIHQPQPA